MIWIFGDFDVQRAAGTAAKRQKIFVICGGEALATASDY
jgi:hypothetical protein